MNKVIEILKKVWPIVLEIIQKLITENNKVKPLLQKVKILKYDNPLNPKVVRTIQYKGSSKRFIKISKTEIAKDISGEIKIVEGNFKPNKKQWKEMPDFSNKLHYNKSNDNKKKVDLHKGHSRNLLWHGASRNKFRVNKITAPAAAYGSKIDISILDKKGMEICRFSWMHLSEINSIMFDKNRVFKSGAYIGRSHKEIGLAIGAHLHTTIRTKGLVRKDLYKIMQGKYA